MKKIIMGQLMLLAGTILFAQNVGIGILNPQGKLHVKGTADITQLIIEANSTQSNTNPLVKLRNSGGNDLLWLHTDDTSNIFLGLHSGSANTVSTGRSNVFIGTYAGASNTVGSANTVIGAHAFPRNTTGYENVAIGTFALNYNSTGYDNTAVGENTLVSNTTGYENTALGTFALSQNSTGARNTANGFSALFVSQGNDNTANGYQSMLHNLSGYSNTAVGFQSLMGNADGYCNTAVGLGALWQGVDSRFNTAVGYMAGSSTIIGYNNTILGAESGIGVDDINNCIAIGRATTTTASNQARIGNSFTTSIGGQVGWSTLSDGRFKKDIQDGVKGIEFIKKLKPVTYYLDVTGISKKLNESRGKELDQLSKQAIEEKQQVLFSGLIAQDVEKAAKEAGYDFSGVDKPKNETDMYSLRYADFVVPLIKAMQEQQQIIERLEKKIELLEKKTGY